MNTKDEIIQYVLKSAEEHLQKLNNCLAFFKGYFDAQKIKDKANIQQKLDDLLLGVFNNEEWNIWLFRNLFR